MKSSRMITVCEELSLNTEEVARNLKFGRVANLEQADLCLNCFEIRGSNLECQNCGYKGGHASESSLYLQPGTILKEKYLIGRVLGQGGFGITYLAWDKILKVKLAIKEYLPQELATRTTDQTKISIFSVSSSSEAFHYGLNQFLEEARLLARYSDFPGVVSVRDFFEENNTAYLVMNYHEGMTLNSYLAKKGGKITVDDAISLFMPVLDALREVHSSGVLHRDISPDNIIINNRGQVVLIDFGAARQAIGEKSKSLTVFMKAGYTPLEQYQSKGSQGPWTDIYAIAASLYRAITGKTVPEAFDRLETDLLEAPSKLGVFIDENQEEVLLKALAVRAADRYRSVNEFQQELLGDHSYIQKKVTTEENKASVKAEPQFGEIIPSQKPPQQKKKNIGILTAILSLTLLIIFAGVYLLRNDAEPKDTDQAIIDMESIVGAFTTDSYDADYIIDYENGSIPLSEVPIGSRVIDLSWEWEFKVGDNYTGTGIIKPVVWLVVAKDHYEINQAHTTLMTEELIGRFAFDDSTDRRSDYGNNHWGDSGTTNAENGLRPWLNSTAKHSEEGFYNTFSEDFKNIAILSTVPNREWRYGSYYNTEDLVFIPSTTEMGDTEHIQGHLIGTAYPYFLESGGTERMAAIGPENWWYWTRSPSARNNGFLHSVYANGSFEYTHSARHSVGGVRPVVNLQSDALVSETRN